MYKTAIYLQLQYELTDMCVDLIAESLFKRKNLHDYWYNVNTADKYLQCQKKCFLFFPRNLS